MLPASGDELQFVCVRLGFINVIQFMLETHRVLPDVRDSDNKTLVFYATANSQPAVLRFLLAQVFNSHQPHHVCFIGRRVN